MALVAFLISRACSVFGLQIIACTFIFRIVERGADAYSLSQLGLVATVASLAFAFPLGFIIDHMNKRSAILVSHFILLLLVISLSILNPFNFLPILVATGLIAVSRNFRSISQFTVFGELLRNKANKDRWVNRSTLSWQIAAFIAPLLAGILGAGVLSLIVACAFISVSFFCQIYIVRFLEDVSTDSDATAVTTHGLIQFLQSNFRLYSSLTLDFFIVLFAGAASLLPFLHPGRDSSLDIGILKSALPAGVIFGTWIRLQKPSLDGWAEKLLLATLGYGFCHLLLAESSSFYFSYTLLFGAGIFDALSLAVRECILQLETPAQFKGRVYALNNFLVNASDELSEWESGVAASWVGVRTAIRISGLVALFGASVFAWKTKQHQQRALTKISVD
tara:strand:+ start:77533 stop:78708 length:1176 start_codon:yes stop_codon:yes gene_type:complete